MVVCSSSEAHVVGDSLPVVWLYISSASVVGYGVAAVVELGVESMEALVGVSVVSFKSVVAPLLVDSSKGEEASQLVGNSVVEG